MKCITCNAVIKTVGDQTELDARADHYAIHNPTPAQWASAYKLMQAAKEKNKSKPQDVA